MSLSPRDSLRVLRHRLQGAWVVWRRCYASTICFAYQDEHKRANRHVLVRLWRAFRAWRRLDYGKHFIS